MPDARRGASLSPESPSRAGTPPRPSAPTLRAQARVPAPRRRRGQILRRDSFQRSRIRSKDCGEIAVTDIIELHRRQIVAAQELSGEPLENARLKLRQRRAERDDGSVVPGELASVRDELAQRIYLGAAEGIAHAERAVVVERTHECVGDVA